MKKGDIVKFNSNFDKESLKISKATSTFNEPFVVDRISDNGYLYKKDGKHQKIEYFQLVKTDLNYEIY